MKKCTCECSCEEKVDYTTFKDYYHSVSLAKLNREPIPTLVCEKCKIPHQK
ncbi:MAG: hypothetical protein ACE5RQ_05230 [Nitrosopumilus sp.]|jgi:hypothetical protein